MRVAGSHYQVFHLEQLFPLLRQLHWQHRHLPPILTPANLDTHRPAHNLVSETHSDDADPVLRKHPLRKLHELQDPWRVVERAVSCFTPATSARLRTLMRVA